MKTWGQGDEETGKRDRLRETGEQKLDDLSPSSVIRLPPIYTEEFDFSYINITTNQFFNAVISATGRA